jgi:glycosyltransferase involved in cell wall biosynthesis
MKVALIVNGGVDPGGTRRVVPCFLWLIRRLAQRHELHVYALFQPGAPPHYDLLGARVHHIGRPHTAVRAIAALWREHRRHAFDVLHAIMASPAGRLATVAGRLFRRPVIVHLCGGELTALPEIGYGELSTARGRRRMRFVFRHAELTAQSAPMVAAAAARGWHATRLPLGVALDAWPLQQPRPRERGRPARLVHVASLSRVKDQTTLLHAAAALVAHGVAFTLDIVGEDTLDGRIQRESRDAGLDAHVRFHGFLEQEAVKRIVQDADLLVVTSRHEGAPIVLAEAAAAGVPTVGTAVGQIAEWAPDAAVAVPVGDYGELARSIAALLDDDARRLHVATRAQQRAAAEDADWTADRVCALYDELVAPS